MKIHKIALSTPYVPEKLRNIPAPPKHVYIHSLGDVNVLLARPCLTVVGSRKVSAYGQSVTARLTEELVRSGVVIISGLAIGVDSIAHTSALDTGGVTIAVLPCGLDRVYPAANRALAARILRQGGALISEYPEGTTPHKQHFIARNRLETALSDAVLITEAAEKSGTLHTARFALEQGKTVLAVPGNIDSPGSVGTNNLMKAGAVPVTCGADVLHALGLATTVQPAQMPISTDPSEQTLLTLLYNGVHAGEELLKQSRLAVPAYNQALVMLEIQGRVRPLGNNQWRLTH